MALTVRSSLIAVVLAAASVGCVETPTSTLVSVETSRGAKQAFILIKPDRPLASVILFAGGHGALGLSSASTMRWGASNFLVRTRSKFAAQDLMVAVIDAPSDRQGGMNAIFRMSIEHAGDIGAVARHLKGQANVPVWLIGTSMGTFSAAAGAIATNEIDGLVLTSTITRSKPDWKIAASHQDGVASMALAGIQVPTLVMSHKNDGCDLTPAADAPKLANRLTAAKPVGLALLVGGAPPRSEPCEAMSEHGFLGLEDEAVDRIVAFVKANSK